MKNIDLGDMLTLKEYAENNRLFVAAHRGASGRAPENTLAAIKEAVELGTGMVEIDVHLTSDKKLAVYHDLSKILGKKDKKIHSWEDLKQLDAGAWFGPQFKGERIPLLSEVLEYIKDKAYLNIEIKALKGNDFSEQGAMILELVAEMKMQEYVLFASFDYPTLLDIKKRNPSLHTAAIKLPGDKRLPSEVIRDTGSDAFICALKEMNDKVNNDIIENEVFTGVYSINTIDDLHKALKYNLNTIGTNFPGVMIEELRKLGKVNV